MPVKAARVAVRLDPGVRDSIYDHVYGNLEGEVGGVLVGYYPEEGPRAMVTVVIPALRATGGRASVTFTHEAWEEIHRELDRYQGQSIVGWYHSHPGFGIFLSEHDLFIHRNFFSGPRQVAFVIDPYVAKEGWFGWCDGKVLPISRETDARRPPRRPRTAPSAPDVHAAKRDGPVWPGRTAYGLLGLLLGVVLWFALLRPDATTQTRSSKATPSQIVKRHPIVVEPRAGVTSRSTAQAGNRRAVASEPPLH